MVPSGRVASSVVRFSVFEFDPKSGELLKRGRRVRISGQPCQILAFLLRRPGELVTRDELCEALWPADTHVNFEQSLNAAVKRLRFALGDSPESPRFIETMSRRGYRFIAPATAQGESAVPAGSPAEAIHSIAVLPFQNATADADADYLSDGLTEAIINALSRLPALRVLARSTVFRYRDKTLDCRALGRKLNVSAVLLGRVSQRGDDLMIGAELVEVENGWLLWGEQFSRKVSDLLLIERELAARISQQLRSELTGNSNDGARRQTASPEAYQDYLKGRYHWNKMSEEGLQKSVHYFQKALEKDPRFALAHAGLADSYTMLGFVGLLPPAEVMPKAKKLAVAALEIDRDLAEGHASLANVLKLNDHDWAAAEREYLQALRLNPNYVHGYRGYAALLAASGRFAESAIQIGHAHDLDPLSVLVSMEMAWNAFIARDYGSAIQHAQRTMELEPESPSAQYILGLACEQVRRFGEASAAIERSLAGSHRHASGLAGLGHVFAVSGRRQEALRLRDELREVARRQYVAPFWHALLDAGLGDEGSALAELERSCDECDLWLIWLNTDPRFNSLRAAPSFQRLLRRARFLEQARSA